MPIITISRQLGSWGTRVAQTLGTNLKSDFFDKETLEEKFEELGLSADSVERYDEKKPGFWDIFKTDKARYLHFMKGILYEFALNGNCVILGRGAQVVLGDLPGILNVRIVAPMETRIQRVMESFDCDERHAENIISHNDHERAGFHKFFFGRNWEDLSLYDLVINTDTFSVESSVKLVKDAVKTNEFKEARRETTAVLKDLSLEHDVKGNIIYYEKIGVQFLEVFAENGVVTIRGIVADEADVERCTEVSKSLEGVVQIKNEVYYKPIATSYGLHY